MYKQMGYVAALLTLAFLSLEDIRKKAVPIWILFMSGSVAVLYSLMREDLTFLQMTENCLPGIVLLFLTFVTKGKIGSGDGVTIVVLGLWTCAKFAFWTACMGMLFAGPAAFFTLLFRRKEREIPLIPLMLMSMEVLLWYA